MVTKTQSGIRSAMRLISTRLLSAVWISLFVVACGGGGGGSDDGSNNDDPADPSVTPTSVDNTPRFAYVLNRGVIGSYVVDPESGNLIPRGNSQDFFEVNPTDIAVHPNGRFLYISDTGGLAGIRRRKIDTQTGVFSTEAADYAITSAGQIVMHPSGRFLFVRRSIGQPITVLAIDPASGDMSLADESVPLDSDAMYLAPDGEFLYVADNVGDTLIYVFKVNANGKLTAVDGDPGTAGTQPQIFSNIALGLGFNPVNNDVYQVDLPGASLARYRRGANGLLSLADSTPIPNATTSAGTLKGLYVEPQGRFGYLLLGNNKIGGFLIDPDDGSLAPIDYDGVAAGIQHLDFGAAADMIRQLGFEPSGRFVYFGFTGPGPLEKYRIDQATGELSQSTTQTELNKILGIGSGSAMAFSTRTNAPDPGPTFAYSQQGSAVGIHQVNPATGMLTDIGNFALPSSASSIYVDPAHQFLYLAQSSQYGRVRIDQATGALSNFETRANTRPNTIGTGDQGLRFDPHNRFAVQTRESGNGMDLMEVITEFLSSPPNLGLGPTKTAVQFSIDPYTASSNIGASTVRPNSRHIYSTGLVSFSGSAVFVLRMFELAFLPAFFDRVDASAAAGHQDFTLGVACCPRDTIVEPLGRYLLTIELKPANNADNLAVYELDWTTGIPTQRYAESGPVILLNHSTGPDPLHIALDPRGRFAYVPNNNGIAVFRFTRNPTGPALEAVDNDPITAGFQYAVPMGGIRRVTIDPTGQWLFSPGSLGTEGFSIDPATGALVSVGLVSPTALNLQVIGNL